MQGATALALLTLAAAAFAAGPPVCDFTVPPGQAETDHSTRQTEATYDRPGDPVAPRATADNRVVCEVCGVALGRSGTDGSWYARQALSYRGTAVAPRMPAWKQAGVYGLEFTGAALGTAFAAAFGLATIEGVYQAGYNGPGAVPSAAVYFLTSAVLSATGTHLMGRLVGQRNSFNRALVGGAVGGLAGGGAFLDYFATRRNPHLAMMPIALVLPPLGAVIAHNIWRSDGK
jgi:hypothetical protein